MDTQQLTKIIEGALFAAGRPLDIAKIEQLFVGELFAEEVPPRDQIRAALEDIEASCEGRGFELIQTGSGYRFQVRQELSSWVNRLWEEKPQRYSRAMLETLALIAYRQPITRGDIEDIRGVSVSSQIIKTMLEREWVRVVGHRDVPGRPALYATTRQFLDYFSLKSLDELPALSEILDIDDLNPNLELNEEVAQGASEETAGENASDSVSHDADLIELEAELEQASNIPELSTTQLPGQN